MRHEGTIIFLVGFAQPRGVFMDKITKLFALAAFSLTAYQQMVLADYRPEGQQDNAALAPVNSRQEQGSYNQSANRNTTNLENGDYKGSSLREDRRLLRDERHVIRDEERLEKDERGLLRDDIRLKRDENKIQKENSSEALPRQFTSPEATPRSYPLSDWPPKAESYSRSSDDDNDDSDDDENDDNDQDNRDDMSYHNHMGTPRSYQYDRDERKGNYIQHQTDNRSSYNGGRHSPSSPLISEAAAPASARTSKKVAFNRPHETTIVDVATNDPSLTTFVQALQASDLSQVLAGKGPFTIFAPSNQAFKKMSPIQLSDLLKPENKQKLTTFLQNHVIAGKMLAADIKEGQFKTANGKELTIKKTGTKMTVNGANVTKTDLIGANGVIHIVDAVLVP